jgi:hypothetical protein
MRLHVHQGENHVDAGTFKESQVNRVGKGKSEGGEFAPKGGGGGSSRAAPGPEGKGKAASPTGRGEGKAHQQAKTKLGEEAPPPAVTVTKTDERAFDGVGNENATRLSKLEAGALGENIAIAYLQSLGLKDARQINTDKPNFPVDLIGDHGVYEVKTGQVSNSRAAQQWRATIGQPSKATTEWLKTASPEEKAAHNRRKSAEIMERKNKVVEEYSAEIGQQIKPHTITLILDPDRGIADVFVYDGFHSRIGYTGPEAKKAYVGSYKYNRGKAAAGDRTRDHRIRGCLRSGFAGRIGSLLLWVHQAGRR